MVYMGRGPKRCLIILLDINSVAISPCTGGVTSRKETLSQIQVGFFVLLFLGGSGHDL